MELVVTTNLLQVTVGEKKRFYELFKCSICGMMWESRHILQSYSSVFKKKEASKNVCIEEKDLNRTGFVQMCESDMNMHNNGTEKILL